MIVRTAIVTLCGGLILAPGIASADGSGIELRDFESFRAVDGMGQALIESRDLVDDVLFTATSAQRAVRRAERAKEDAIAKHGMDSHDAAVAEGRLRSVKREQLAATHRELQRLIPRIKAAERRNQQKLRRLLGERRNFHQLVEGHLRSKRNPAVLATLVYLATARLAAKSEELYANVVLGKLDFDIKETTKTLELVSRLVDPGVTTITIEEAWSDLVPDGGALAATTDETIDDLDALLGKED